MKKIFKSKKIIATLFIVFLCCICFCVSLNKNNNEHKIDSILASRYYSYLPIEAKEYIKEIYEDTGEVIYTEKNKKDNLPYLNPQYVNYLTQSDEYKKEYGYIPSETIVDYVYGTNPSNGQLPESFDLRNVDGKNYVTPVQNQIGGLCWAYSSTAQIESLLLINSGQSYTDGATIFSERQLDYATSKNGIIGDKSLYPYRMLYEEGGAYGWPWSVEVDSLGLVDISWEKDIGDSTNKLEPNKVYNFSNSLYEVDNTVAVPNINLATLNPDSEEDMQKRDEYLNTIKEIIKNYGGAVVGSVDPDGKCAIASGDTTLIYNNRECSTGGSHAMQIIGWDDNYEYSFCKKPNQISADISSCSQSNIVSGKGVWILKNSWGEDSTPYPYLAYDNYDLSISAVKSVNTKNWDNYYHGSASIGATYVTIKKDIKNDEKVNKIKLNINNSNVKKDELDVYISTRGDDYRFVGSIDTNLPGYYTLDLSDENIVFNNTVMRIKAKYGNSTIWWGSGDDVRLYTNNVNDSTYIQTEYYVYNDQYASHDYYEIRLNQQTKGIPENSAITYKILDDNNNEITDNYSFEENTVYGNRVYPKIIINASLAKGEYKIQSLYNNEVKSESKLVINGSPIVITGDGTSQNPYIITNPIQLDLVRENKRAYFELGNDIDLSYDTQNENGLFYNGGLGWEPIEYESSSTSDKFSGSFNGKGYKIKGLYINRPDENYVGLFKNIYSYGEEDGNEINIVNLILENPNITGNDYVGGIAGNIDAKSNMYLTNLQNLYIIGGNITGNNYVGGIAGNFRGGTYYNSQSNRINSLFNSSSISASNYAGGLFGNVENTHDTSGMKVYIKNIINIGEVSSEGNASGLIGNVKMRNDNPISIENALNIGIIKGSNCSSGITCQLDSEASGTLNLKNIYYIDDYGYDTTNASISSNNVKQKRDRTITDVSNYSDWDLFDKYWKIEAPNNITRIPTLKNMNVDYISSSIDKIVLNISQNVNVASSINNESQIKYTIMDTSIASINDGVVVGKNIGMTNLIISSKYEQLIIPVYVISQDEYTISFDANGGEGLMDDMILTYGESRSLPINDFTKVGYNFAHWNTKADDSGVSYSNKEFVSLNDNLKLYAIWKPIKYNIYWYNEDGTKSNTGTNQYDVEYTFSGYKWTLKTGYMFKEWNTKMDGTGTSYKEVDKFKNLADRNYASVKLYSILEPIQYEVQFDANGGIGNIDSKVYKYDKEESLLANTFTKEGYLFKEWNTKADGSGTSYSDKQVILNLCNNNGDIIKLYAIWQTEVEPIKTIVNNSKDFEGVYDGIEHSIVINVNINDYTIKYSVNSYEYNLSKLPKFKDVGEYTVNYKITADGYETLTGSNVVKIFGLKSFNSELTVKNNIIITNNNSFDNLINGITTYSTSTIFKHLDNNRNVDNTSIIKTGDIVLIRINNSLNYEYKISYLGDTNGDGKINYLDYVNVYNHIQKVKHPESTKKLLKNEYLMAADMSNDGNITYLDYVKIYKKIKELKGGAN